MAELEPDALAKMQRKYGPEVVLKEQSKFDAWALKKAVTWENDQHYTRSFWKSLSRAQDAGWLKPLQGGGDAAPSGGNAGPSQAVLIDLVSLCVLACTGTGAIPISDKLKGLCDRHPSFAEHLKGLAEEITGEKEDLGF